MNVGVFAIDPGGATGLAWGIFDTSHPLLGQVIEEREFSASHTVEGSYEEQTHVICRLWREFFKDCTNGHHLDPEEEVQMACEDFTPRGAIRGESMAISLKLIGAITGYRMGTIAEWERNNNGPAWMPVMHMQTAGEAAQLMPDKRLKEVGWWSVGKEHERSAYRHLAVRLEKIRKVEKVRARTRGQRQG